MFGIISEIYQNPKIIHIIPRSKLFLQQIIKIIDKIIVGIRWAINAPSVPKNPRPIPKTSRANIEMKAIKIRVRILGSQNKVPLFFFVAGVLLFFMDRTSWGD